MRFECHLYSHWYQLYRNWRYIFYLYTFEFARTPNEAPSIFRKRSQQDRIEYVKIETQKVLHWGRMMTLWRRTIRYSDCHESVERIDKIWDHPVYTYDIVTSRYFIASIINEPLSANSDLSRFVFDHHEQIFYDIREVTNDHSKWPPWNSLAKSVERKYNRYIIIICCRSSWTICERDDVLSWQRMSLFFWCPDHAM